MDIYESISDMIEHGRVSDCCGVQVVMEDICMDCKEHCSAVCEDCGEETCICDN